MFEEQRAVDEEHEHRYEAADRARKAPAEGEHVKEGKAAAHRVPDAHPELVVGQQPGRNRRGDDPELERRLFEEDRVLVRTAERVQPVTALEDPIHRVGVDGLVVLHVRAAQADEQRQRERRHNDRQPERPAQSFTHVTRDQIRGTFTFSIEIGSSADCARNAGRSRSALKPM